MKKIRNLLISIIVFITLLLVCLVIFTPILIKMSIEKGGTKLVGAKVEIAKLKMKYLDLSFLISGLEVTNPNNTKRNIFEVSAIKYKMDLNALLKGYILIETIQVTNVRVNTPRKKDGAINKKIKNNKESKENIEIFNNDIFNQINNFNYNKYINENIKTLKEIDNFKENSIKTYNKWENEFKQVQYHNDIKKIYDDIKNINANINNPAEYSSKYQKIMNTKKRLNNITNDFNTKKSNLQKDFISVENDVKSLEKTITNDFNNILKKANIKNISIENISSLIFKDEIMKHVDHALFWAYKIKKIIPKSKPKTSINKDKKIKKKNKFFIKEILISTSNKDSKIKNFPIIIGKIHNISDNQNRVNKPIDANLSLQIPELISFKTELDAVIDRQNDIISDKYKISIDNIILNEFNLLGNYGLPDKINNSNLDLDTSIAISEEKVTVTGNIILDKVNFVYNKKEYNELSSIIKSIFKDIKNIKLKLQVIVMIRFIIE